MRKLKAIEMQRLTVDEFRRADKLPLTVVLDDVRSMYNVGSVLRSCDAFRVEAVYLCGITATPPSAEIHKTALGAEDSVAWRHFDTAAEAVDQLHAAGATVLAVEQVEGSTKLQQLHSLLTTNSSPKTSHSSLLTPNSESTPHSSLLTPNSGKWAVVLGNEVKGVHQHVVDMCDGCLEIPQMGTKHSLNVSVTAGIVVWEFARALMLR